MANSKALTRVKNNKRAGNPNPTSEGIFLSNAQIVTLGNALQNTGIADGAFFMIGKDLVAGKVIQTVEILAYNVVGVNKIIMNQGHLNVNIGKADPASANSVTIDNDAIVAQTYSSAAPAGAGVQALAVTRGSQRTPPPIVP